MLIFLEKKLPCLRFVPLLFLGFIPYGIFSVPWTVQCTIWILHVVPMVIYCLEYCELLLLYLAGLAVCVCIQIIQICAYRLIGGDKLLIT